jgi:nicotinamide-nucleotide adenylyltransferase
MSRALYVGRFQPFHLGHLYAIRYVADRSLELIVMIGSAQYSHTLKDPFTSGERVTMIRLALDEAGVDASRYYIIPVTDLNLHEVWVAHVVSYVPKFDVVYTNEPLTRRLFLEDKRFPVKPIPLYKRKSYSATEVRKRMLNKDRWKELLPKSVVKLIEEVNGVERLRDLNEDDRG